jgi:hypothetical protein
MFPPFRFPRVSKISPVIEKVTLRSAKMYGDLPRVCGRGENLGFDGAIQRMGAGITKKNLSFFKMK